MKQLKLAVRAFLRDLRSGELRILGLALCVAVASVTAVGFFTDRIGRAMEHQAADVLAADLRVTAGQPLDDALQVEAESLGLATANTTLFPSVVINELDESQLVAVKAVSNDYPLRGQLELELLDGSKVKKLAPGVGNAPAPGTVWVDIRLKNTLALTGGSVIELGTGKFTVERIIAYEPDAGENVFELAPRVMMHEDDLQASGLVGPGSRARYTLLLAGEAEPLEEMNEWVEGNHATTVRVQGVRDGNRSMRRALERAESFLGLAAVVTVLLAGAAIALAVRQFALQQADASAVMRTLGATRGEVIAWLSWRLVLVATLASIIGVIVGWIAQLVLVDLLYDWFTIVLPAPGISAPVVGVLTAFVALAGFGLLPVLRAGQVAVMRVLQRDYSGLDVNIGLALVCAIIAAFAVILLQSGNLLLSAIVVGGVLVMLGVFALFGRGMIKLVRRMSGQRFRLSVAGLERRAGSSVVQLAAFALGIMALLLITIVRTDVLAAWERDVPATAPNTFVVNIQPSQVESFADRLKQQSIDTKGFFPMVRARMVSHNNQSLVELGKTDEHMRRHSRFEYNLTYTDSLPESNELVEGEWWDAENDTGFLSIEHEWAEHMGYEIGDTLTFSVAGEEATGTIKNLRKVDWESFNVNFFAVGSTELLQKMPATFVTSIRLGDDMPALTAGWAREFPGIATFDVGAIITRVKRLMDRASVAVEYVFSFTLVAGLVVLLAAVQSSRSERIRESAILRALGASHAQVRTAVITEYAILGAIAGLLAALFATVVAWAISRFVLELAFVPNPFLWVIGIISGTIGISIAGYLATRSVLRMPPLVALRQN